MKTQHQRGIVIAFAGMLTAIMGVTIYQQVPMPVSGSLLSMGMVTAPIAAPMATVPMADPMMRAAAPATAKDYSQVGLDFSFDPNEVVLTVQAEDGTVTSYTRAQLNAMNSASSVYEYTFDMNNSSMDSDSPDDNQISTTVCTDIVRKETPSPIGYTQEDVIKGQKVVFRCDKNAAEASAKADALQALKNTCAFPLNRCPQNCAEGLTNIQYGDVTYSIARMATYDKIDICAGGIAYRASIQATGTCTATRPCSAKKQY